MTKGIKLSWYYEEGRITEIEYLRGIDVDNLDHIPEFTTTFVHWPGYPMAKFNVVPQYKRPEDGVVHLVIEYAKKKNRHLVDQYPDYPGWGTNTIFLKKGKREGKCHWLRCGKKQTHVLSRWEAFDVEGNSARPRAIYSESRRQERQERQEHFRALILVCDDNRCALTGERTKQALEAAHLVPANGQNDEPFNGITLRVDLHRLFDAGLFTFDDNGQVVISAQADLSAAYCKLLRKKKLPERTFDRVCETLSRDAFIDRQNG